METKEFVVTVRRRQFDEIAYRMISENEIYGIIDFSVEEQANDVLVSYQNEAYVPLPVYFERELTRAEILRIFENYFAIMDWRDFCWMNINFYWIADRYILIRKAGNFV